MLNLLNLNCVCIMTLMTSLYLIVHVSECHHLKNSLYFVSTYYSEVVFTAEISTNHSEVPSIVV